MTIATIGLALLGAVNLALSIIILRRLEMPTSATLALTSAVAFLNESADRMTAVGRTLIDKLNAVQDFGRAQGQAAAAAQIADLNSQIAALQEQIAANAADPALVKQLQGQVTDLQDKLDAAVADSSAKDQAMIAAAQNVTDIARQISNQADGIGATLDEAATNEDPAAGVLDKLPTRTDS